MIPLCDQNLSPESESAGSQNRTLRTKKYRMRRKKTRVPSEEGAGLSC